MKRHEKNTFRHFEFKVTLSGYGKTPLEAWNEAIEGFYLEPGMFKKNDIILTEEVDEDTLEPI